MIQIENARLKRKNAKMKREAVRLKKMLMKKEETEGKIDAYCQGLELEIVALEIQKCTKHWK
jgi:hypothetical protein